MYMYMYNVTSIYMYIQEFLYFVHGEFAHKKIISLDWKRYGHGTCTTVQGSSKRLEV